MTAQTASTTHSHPIGEAEGRTTSQKAAAGWAAAGYAAIFVLAIFANFLALDPVIHADDPAATAAALRDSESAFRLGGVAFLGIFVIDVVIAWALWILFRPVHRDLSLLSAWFRLTYTVVLGAALGFLYIALWLAGSPDSFGASNDDFILLALQAFDFTWVAGLAAFGAHLVVLGALLIRARGPRWLGRLLQVAGAAYVVDTVAHIALSDYEASADAFLLMVALPSVIGEMGFAIWLLLAATGRRTAARAERLPAQ